MKIMQWTLAVLMVAGVAQAKTELEKKQDYFRKWDANGDDKLTAEEFSGMVQAEYEKKGLEGYEAEAAKRFANKNPDGDDAITWNEYLQDMVKRGALPADVLDAKPEVRPEAAAVPAAAPQAEVPANIQKLYKKWDADGDGKMSLEEYTAMTKVQFEKSGKEGYEAEATKRFEYKDENGDGSLTLEEFNRTRAK